MGEEKPLIAVLRGEALPVPPVWLMRQAGRFLPEYRELRAHAGSFLDTCYNPEIAARITLQPIERFGFDAAILFSDILVVPDALGQKVSFESGHGPKLEPIGEPKDLERLAPVFDADRLAPVYETIARVKRELPERVAFIGFCGAPWTVASYMIAGEGTPDQAPARLFAYRHPEAFGRLIDRLVDASIAYLTRQIDAGVEALQIFDSWAGVLPPQEFERWVVSPLQRIIAELKQRRPAVPIIAFVRGAGPHLPDLAQRLGADALGLDTFVPPQWAAREVSGGVALQGNLDPLALVAGGEALDRQTDAILEAFAGRPHIFNLGHGVLPETPLDHVARLVDRIRNRG
ncbi:MULTISPECIES: uroporphyrinogen decarboxylase [Methylosinus]|uniref:Uroporphyrinogen decarboxylase n=1 Tax=Methylosinus trichosporium (strain ATCC 35070 / NCIMB 11131 / UNIQEM 75 / OB3b) TaxID=595536 RepID=A0A2D2D100_METT3|nr:MULTISPECIES: uroporphyrinogen decarboxylase [Methylosinus]ATQ68660.1 uroporphyrinogen decarboxylase [Methylosinus trichosporium OB3b]OBS53176.1 uroporphyrinogen decarboxylase [Methylosinus sp. 3S-1]